MSMAPDGGSEVRVHGIGNHGPLSALGSPRMRDGRVLGRGSTQAAVVQPVTGDHSLWFVAWSRSSRSLNSVAWFIGLPFTVCNTAGHMRSPGWFGAVTAASAVVVGCMLTLGAFLWSVVVVENIYYALRVPTGHWAIDVPEACLVMVTVFWIFLLLKRAFRLGFERSELSPGAQALAVLQSLLISVTAWLIWRERPATSTDSCWGFDPPPCLVEKHDWAATVGWVTIALTAAVLTVLALVSLIDTKTNWIGGGSFPHLGTGVTLMLAAVLLHVGASGVVLLVDLVARYADWMNPWRWGGERSIPLLRQYDAGDLIYRGSDTLAATWAPIVLLLVSAMLAWRVVRRVSGSSGELAARMIHRVITRPGRRAYPVCVIAAVVVVGGVLVWTVGRMDAVQLAGISVRGPEGLDQGMSLLTVGGMHVLIVALPFALLSRDVRSTIAVLSDVVGYWSVVHHPLAAPPYRFDVINNAATQIAELPKPVVIVGHSQGSVLAVDLVRHLSQQEGYDRTQHGLITCGSPLASLYSTYFPKYFPTAVRTDTQSRVSEWRNLWRSTDPISTELDLGDDADTETLDGNERGVGSELRKHGDYWIEEDQVEIVEKFLSAT